MFLPSSLLVAERTIVVHMTMLAVQGFALFGTFADGTLTWFKHGCKGRRRHIGPCGPKRTLFVPSRCHRVGES